MDNTEQIIFKLKNDTTVKDIESFFYSKCHRKQLFLDVSESANLSSSTISFILEKKDRIFLLNPTDRILVVLRLLAIDKIIKIIETNKISGTI
jgi:hypothetical protein